jgi:Uncharacterized protein conserved in bacteria (DUF2125)
MMRRRLTNICAIIAVVLFAAYTAAWCFGLSIQRTQIDDLWANGAQQGVVLSRPTPAISGYPGKYRIKWSGQVRTQDGEMTIPDLVISYLPVPKTTMTIAMPNGLQFSGKKLNLPPETPALTFHHFRADIEIPTLLPETWTKGEVQKLHDAGIVYRLTNLEGAGPVLPTLTPAWRGYGQLEFDDLLQPRGFLMLEFQEPEKIRDMLMVVIRSPLGKSFAQGAVNSMMKTDTKTGKTTLPITFRFESGKLYAGPLQVAYLGLTHWPIDNPPAPDQ